MADVSKVEEKAAGYERTSLLHAMKLLRIPASYFHSLDSTIDLRTLQGRTYLD